jgi:hypothetical protein
MLHMQRIQQRLTLPQTRILISVMAGHSRPKDGVASAPAAGVACTNRIPRLTVRGAEGADHAAGCATASSLASRWISALLIAACRVGALIWAPSRSVT